jgi:hypothetical protein
MLLFYTALDEKPNSPQSFGFFGNRYLWFRLCALRALSGAKSDFGKDLTTEITEYTENGKRSDKFNIVFSHLCSDLCVLRGEKSDSRKRFNHREHRIMRP